MQQPVAQLDRVLTQFAILPNTNQQTDILQKIESLFMVLLHYQSVIIKWRTRHMFTKSNGLYANRVGNTTQI